MSTDLATGRDDQAISVWVRLLRAHAELSLEFNRALNAEHGLTVNDYEVLLQLAHAENDRMRRVDLAEEVRLTASGMTRLLDGLQHSGYVEKAECPEDGRVTYAVLTDAGRAKLERASETHRAAVRALFEERYTARELETLVGLLDRLPGARRSGPC
jgi:DNA-binding MarR family transcriptional regulator